MSPARIDKFSPAPLISAVLRFRRILAVLLLALWLPATLHCGLEAAGLDAVFHCTGEHDSTAPDAASRDACDLLETGTFKPASDTAALPPLALQALLLCFVVPAPATDLNPPIIGVSDRVAAPPEVARTWHFVARAAPLARAPSAVS